MSQEVIIVSGFVLAWSIGVLVGYMLGKTSKF